MRPHVKIHRTCETISPDPAFIGPMPYQDLPPPPAGLLDDAGLFLDFDGTLVDLADRPDGVVVGDSLHALLRRRDDVGIGAGGLGGARARTWSSRPSGAWTRPRSSGTRARCGRH